MPPCLLLSFYFCFCHLCFYLCLISLKHFLLFLFCPSRPGLLKDLKTMGSISLFIFFITLLVLARQVSLRCNSVSDVIICLLLHLSPPQLWIEEYFFHFVPSASTLHLFFTIYLLFFLTFFVIFTISSKLVMLIFLMWFLLLLARLLVGGECQLLWLRSL